MNRIALFEPLNGGSPFNLTKMLTVIGRSRDECDVVLELRRVSKIHCAIARYGGTVVVRDLGSTNGIQVNGRRIQEASMRDGDTLGIDHLRFRLRFRKPAPGRRRELRYDLNDDPTDVENQDDDVRQFLHCTGKAESSAEVPTPGRFR